MAIAMVIIVALTGKVHAMSSAPVITVCHHTPANAVTLTFQNLQSYAGHLATPHNNQTFDTAGACTSPTVTATPSIEPSPSSEPTVTVSLSATPEATLTPTSEPTATPSVSSNNGGDGKSDGLSSCPDCTKAHVLPAAPPATGKGE